MKLKKTLLLMGLLSTAFVLGSCSISNQTNNIIVNPNETEGESESDNQDSSGEQGDSSDQGGSGEQGDSGDQGGSTDPAVEYVTVTYYEGNAVNHTELGTQQVIKGRTLLDQLVAPKKEGYEFVSFHNIASNSEYLVTDDYVITKDRVVYVEYDMIDMNSVYNYTEETSSSTGATYLNGASAEKKANFYAGGYVTSKFDDFSQYENTSAYVKVTNADQLVVALENARNEYTSTVDEIVNDHGKTVRNNVRKNETNWINAITKGLYLKNDDGTYTQIPSTTPYSDTTYTADMTYYEDAAGTEVTIKQTLTSAQTVHVIEIMNDIDLGYYKLSAATQASSIVNSFCSKYDSAIAAGTTNFTVSSMLKEYGMTQINVSNSNNLLIYSKNGAKLTHGGFKVSSCDRVAFRNLEMDEMWQWEDSSNATPNFTIGDMDVFGWAYFKISFCGYVWIDHCTFGKSYDGQIDVSNPYFYSVGTASSAPYGKPTAYTESDFGGVHISNCKFTSGSDDEEGYLYKMMEEIEADYQKSLTDSTYSCKYLYYKTLRDSIGLTFEEILYGVAIPQKKAFLLGDSSESKKSDTYYYNQHLSVSFADCVIIDIEDRLPNVRGGIAYMYNTLVDNSRYYKYREALVAKGAQNIGAWNSAYKLALVSQGIVAGYGASVYANNCIFIGIDTLVKNNNKEKDENDPITDAQMAAGYSLINCKWYNDKESSDYTRIINTDTTPDKIKSTESAATSASTITVAAFDWHNSTSTNPITPSLYDLDNLTQTLLTSYYVGVNPLFAEAYLLANAE